MKTNKVINESAQEITDNPPQETQRYQSFAKLTFLCLTYSLSFFFIGYNFVYFGTFDINEIVSIYDIQIDKFVTLGLVTASLLLGAFVGFLITSCILNLFSRKKSIILVNILGIIIISLSLINNFGLLFFCRITQGIFVGFYSCFIPKTMAEILPKEVQNSFNPIPHIMTSFGVFMALLIQYLITSFNSQQELWRLSYGFGMFSLILQTLLMLTCFNYQSPNFLLMQEKEEKVEQCREILSQIYKEEYLDEILRQKKIQIGMIKETQPQMQITQQQILQTKENEPKKQEKKQTVENKKQIKKNDDRAFLRKFIAIFLGILQQLAGIQAFAAYGVLIVSQVFPQYALLIPMLLTITPIIVGFTINCIMRSLGRKTIIQVGTFLVFIGHTLLAIGNYLKEGDSIPDVSKALVVLGFFIVVMSFGVSLGNVTFLYASEIVPNRFVNISILVSWVFATIVAIVIPILFSVIENLAPIFTFFAAWCLISFCLNCKLMVQTKDKSIKKVLLEYQEMSFC